jgi:hypothetical protein
MEQGDEQGQQQQQQHSSLQAVYVIAEERAPQWSKDGCHLIVQLPGGRPAATCRGVRLQLGGMLLPATVTDSASIQRTSHGMYKVAGLWAVKPLLQGATLQPCGAVDVQDGWVLVVRAEWEVAKFGQQVSHRLCHRQIVPTNAMFGIKHGKCSQVRLDAHLTAAVPCSLLLAVVHSLLLSRVLLMSDAMGDATQWKLWE